MEFLKQKGLYGEGLIKIDREIWVKRYNECLEDMGIEPTKLTEFQIDGIGWSPEIAEEKDNVFYLTHNYGANQYGIILTPLQHMRPIYTPIHSYDEEVMDAVFTNAYSHIADITLDTAIWIEIYQDIDFYTDPADLLMVDSVSVDFHSTNGLLEASQKIKQLIKSFYTEKDAWLSQHIRNQIKEISQKFGDLRNRTVDLISFKYNNLQSFSTRAFNGVTILRGLPSGKNAVIIENDKFIKPPRTNNYQQFHIKYPSFIKFLRTEKLVDVNLERYYLDDIEIVKRAVLFEFFTSLSQLGNITHSVIDISTNNALYSKYLTLLQEEKLLTPNFLPLYKLYKTFHEKTRITESNIDENLKQYLYQPRHELTKNIKSLIWYLLAKLYPVDFASVYTYNKRVFYEKYITWDEPVKQWVAYYLDVNKDKLYVD